MSSNNQMVALSRLGTNFIAGQGMLQNQRTRALQEQRAEQAFQSQQQQAQRTAVVKTAAERLMQNPEDALDGLDPDLKFDARMAYGMQMKQKFGNDKAEMAADFQRTSSLMNGAMADIVSGSPGWEKSFTAAQAHARDGFPKMERDENGQVVATDYDGKKQIVENPTKEQALEWLKVHSDPKQYFTAKIADRKFLLNHNSKQMDNKQYAVGANGVKGWEISDLRRDMDSDSYNEYFIVDPQTGEPTPVPKKTWDANKMTTVKEAKSWADINKALSPQVSDIITVDGKPMKEKDVFNRMKVLGDIIFEKKPGQLDIVAAIMSGAKIDPNTKGVSDLFAQRDKMLNSGNPEQRAAAQEWTKYYNAIYGGGSGTVQKKSWRDYKD